MRTVTVRRTIAAPIERVFDWITDAANYRQVPGVLRAEVTRAAADGGVGTVREVTTAALKLTEEIVGYERPVRMDYLIRASIPPLRHEGGSMRLRTTADGTEVTWVSTFEVGAPVFSGAVTRAFAPAVAFGFRTVLRTAERKLTGKG
ncbi:SRPBCC family protein [Nocardia sp. CA-129566]|uniref:SRPBCC family protein n=1 Tax=Nocardia sp. CA-129566 TaxID=3239976 RepID=UPI003D99E59C